MIESLRADAAPVPDALVAQLVAAGISVGVILDPAETDPRMRDLPTAAAHGQQSDSAPHLADPAPHGIAETPPAGRAPMPRLAAVPQAPPVRLRPGEGLRLLPLAGFHWGGSRPGKSMTQVARVRGDHVLLRLEQGAVSIDFPRGRHLLTAGRLAFIPAGTAFALSPPDDVAGQALLIPPAAFQQHALPAGFRSGSPAVADASMILPSIMALTSGATSQQHDPATWCQLELLSVALSRLTSQPEQPGQSHGSLAGARVLTERFLRDLHRNPGQGRTMAELAAQLGCSLAQLDRACKQARGRSALELLYDLRLELAAQALRQGDRPMAEIAQDCGYDGLSHFMRAFQSATGRTPDTYRRWLRDGTGIVPED